MAKMPMPEKGHPEHDLHKDVRRGHMHPEHEHGAHHDGREKHGRGANHEGGKGAPHEARGNRGEHEPTGRDAAETRPHFIPDFELLARDDSGGPEWTPYTAEFGDGGYTTGYKAHLTPGGGEGDKKRGDEIDRSERRSGRSEARD